jgi:hypothetical protein
MRAYPHRETRDTGEPDDRIGSTATRVPGITQMCGVLEVPTTASLRQQARVELPGATSTAAGGVGHDLFYLHDYDLLDPRKRLAVRIIANRRRSDATTVSSLISSMLGTEH